MGVIENNGEPSRARTCDPLIKSAFRDTPAGYGSYDLLTSVTGCSRQRVYLLFLTTSCLRVVLSQVCLFFFFFCFLFSGGKKKK